MMQDDRRRWARAREQRTYVGGDWSRVHVRRWQRSTGVTVPAAVSQRSAARTPGVHGCRSVLRGRLPSLELVTLHLAKADWNAQMNLQRASSATTAFADARSGE